MRVQVNIKITPELSEKLKNEDILIDNYIQKLIDNDLDSKILSSDSNFYFNKNHSKLYDFNNKEINLTKKENLLLKYLISNKNVLKSYDEIIENCWDQKKNVDITSVKNLIKRIRKKTSFSFIKTHYGEGYSLPIK